MSIAFRAARRAHACKVHATLSRNYAINFSFDNLKQNVKDMIPKTSVFDTIEDVPIYPKPYDGDIRMTTTDDSSYKGNSSCQYDIEQEVLVDEEDGKDSKVPFLRYKGKVDFDTSTYQVDQNTKEVPDEEVPRQAVRGFCSMNMHFSKMLDLVNHEGFEIIMRSKKDHKLILNMKSETMIPGSMYQVAIDIAGYKNKKYQEKRPRMFSAIPIEASPVPHCEMEGWVKIHVPFHMFKLTRRGQMLMANVVNDCVKLESLGFLMTAEGGEEEFEIDILHILAVTDAGTSARTEKIVFKSLTFEDAPYVGTIEEKI